MNSFSKLDVKDVLNFMPDPMLIVDTLGTIEFCNIAFTRLLGYSADELHGQNIINHLADESTFDACLLELEQKKVSENQTTIFVTKDKRHVATTKNVKLIELENEKSIFVNFRDISEIEQINYELKRSKRELEQKSHQLTNIIDEHKKAIEQKQLQLDEIISVIDEIIWYIDDQTLEVKYVSNAIESIFLETREGFLNESFLWMEMIYKDDKQDVMDFFANIKEQHSGAIEFRLQRRDGEIRWLSNTITHHPSLGFFIGVTHDITQQKIDQDKIEFMAYHDTLTNLPNRSYLKDEIDMLLKKSEIVQQNFAVLFLDLDNFKYINDSMGHDIGDEILVEVSNRLRKITAGKGTCIRFGGDEFVIIMNNIQTQKDINIVTKLIINKINQPYLIQEREFFISVSIGVSLYPQDAQTFTELIKAADTAMYQAKISGKNKYVTYKSSMDMGASEFLRIERIIKDALTHDYLALYFQPLIDAKSMTLCGFEALLRLNHPEYGSISPETFIPIAEASGDIIPISDFVMFHVCRFTKEINKISPVDLTISINISARQLKEPNFAKNFLRCLDSHEIDPKLIKIEMLESAVMDNIRLATKELKILRGAGVQVALDDFGTGYSSFAYLAKLPIDTIKIDKSFIIPLLQSSSNKHIVKAITSLAHHLHMNVTAEGVETHELVEHLQGLKVDTLQGFYFQKALPADAIIENFPEHAKLFNLSL